MKREILIASFDMEVGGVERSLISLLEHYDYKSNKIDLMLFKHQGEFMDLLPEQTNLLEEDPHYSTFRKSIRQVISEKRLIIAFTRILAKFQADIIGKMKEMVEPGYYQMQLMWRYALPYLPTLNKEYDVAISYLWPHDFIAEKVKANKKIAWIHTDYSKVEVDRARDLEIWEKFNFIVAVSEECKQSFLKWYPQLQEKVIVIENINSPGFVRKMAEQKIEERCLLNDKRFKIVTVARLSHAKGIDNAVRALKLLKEKGINDIAWYVVGYGGDKGEIQKLINELSLNDSFILLGKKLNPYPYVKRADLYVQPSRYEGKAVTVTEAQILSRPVIITNYSTAKSQIQDGVDGIITELSVEGIAKAIKSLYENKQKRIMLKEYCKNKDYGNERELEKLYELI